MAGPNKKNAESLLLLALACGATVETAARTAGVSERTVYRKLKDAEFQKRLRDMRAEMLQRTSGTMTAASSEAVKTLLTLLKDNTPHSVRLGAARAVLEIGMKIREMTELEARITALEEQLGQATAR